MMRAFVLWVIAGLCFSGFGVGDRVEALRRFLSLPPRKRAEVLAKWRLIKQLPQKKQQEVLKRLKRWAKLPGKRRRMLLRRWRKWRIMRLRLMESLPPDRRLALLRLPPWKRNAELVRIFNRHMLGVYRRLLRLLSEEQRKRLLSLPQEEFLSAMRRLLEERRRVAFEAVIRNLPLPLKHRIRAGEIAAKVVLAERYVRHERAFRALGEEKVVEALKRAPAMVRFVEMELAWQRFARRTAKHIMGLPVPRRRRLLQMLQEGVADEKMPNWANALVKLPDKARGEVLMLLERAPLAPPPGPR